MRIFHGTTVAGPKLFLRGPGETLNVQLDAEYTFSFEVGTADAPPCNLTDCNRMRAAGFEYCTRQHGLEAGRRRQPDICAQVGCNRRRLFVDRVTMDFCFYVCADLPGNRPTRRVAQAGDTVCAFPDCNCEAASGKEYSCVSHMARGRNIHASGGGAAPHNPPPAE